MPGRARGLPFVIGVISDTHGLLRPGAMAALRGSQHIIHAGDVGDPAILNQLGEIAPLTTVRGNVDTAPWASKLATTEVVEAGSVHIFVLHDLAKLDLNPAVAGFAAVVYGHTHIPKREIKNGVLYFNPGSAGPRRFRLPVSVGRIIVDGGLIRTEELTLDV